MSNSSPKQEKNMAMLDRSDERVTHSDNLSGAIKAFFSRIRSGDLGMLPVALGLIIISTVFSILNPVFLALVIWSTCYSTAQPLVFLRWV